LVFSFPEVHEDAKLIIGFERTLRIPDDGKNYPLPPGLGRFPLRHIDDFSSNIPEEWVNHGGVMLPMYQSEAMWIDFDGSYPFAVKIGTGKINAVTGQNWSDWLTDEPQDYLSLPEQPWLDGYCVEKGIIRQFVAMPLGAGYTAEEQITKQAEHGGLQIVAYPMKREAYERHFPEIEEEVLYDKMPCFLRAESDMGLAPGGRMEQEIYDDPYDLDEWDMDSKSRCFVHISNSLVWRAITGDEPPTAPPTSKEYTNAGMPWFDYYSDGSNPLKGSKILKELKSIVNMGNEKGFIPLPENETVKHEVIIKLRKGLQKNQVREGRF